MAAPVRTDLDSDLVKVLDALPPFVGGRNRHLADDLTRRCMGKRQGTVRTLRDIEEQVMLAFWQAGEGMQTTIRAQAFDQRRRTKVAQEDGSRRSIKRLHTRRRGVLIHVQQIEE